MEVQKLWIDLETYSETPIKNGTYRYAEDSEIMLFLYAFDDGEPQCLDFTDPDDGWEKHAKLQRELTQGNSELWAHNCVTGDHEVRTREGWVRLDNLTHGAEVMQWCPSTEALTYTPSELIVQDYEGVMLTYDSLFHKGAYTPNHRVYFKTAYGEGWRVETAQKYAERGPNSAKVPVSGVYTPEVVLNLSPLECRIAEMIRADAHICRERGRVRFNFTKARKIERASELLTQAGWGFYTYIYGEKTSITLHNNPRLSYIESLLGRGRDKSLGPWVLDLPPLSRLAWLDETQYWDGVRPNLTERGDSTNKQSINVTSHKESDIRWLVDMAHLTGLSASPRFNLTNNRGFSREDGLLHKVAIRPRGGVKTLYPPETVTHKGKVYCVSVPTGAFMVRRKGAIWITGNSMFDRTVLNYNDLSIDLNRVRDTMVQALCHALPGGLDKLCEILGIGEDNAKLKDGRALIQLFCKPRPKNMKLRRATRETHPEQWARFIEYGKADIRAMRAAHYAMPKFNYPNGQSDELGNWHLDQKINDRGFLVDLDLVNSAIDAVKLEKESLKQQGFDSTNGAVTSLTKRDQVLEHILLEYGIPLPDLTKATLERRINDPDIPRGVKELLALRLQATTTSTSKYVALQKAANDDGRCRGTIQFGGASRTLRAAGRTFQPQNLPSRGLLEDYEIDFGIHALKAGEANFFYPNIMKLLSSCVRGVLIASPGKMLAVADLSNIEGRFAAWVSGELWKIQAFRDFDEGTGHDLYNLAYSRAFKIPVEEVKKHQRAIGKVMELMLGYAGGVGAFVTGALGYGFDLEELAKDNWDTLPDDQLKEANSFYGYVIKRKMNTFGLSKEAFITCDVLKRLWRESNPNIASMWTRLEEAIRSAISNPKEVFEVGEFIKVLRNKNWLRIRLPSGRSLCYANPRLDERGEISYMGLNNYTRQWSRIKLYGGMALENLCQAGSRDILYGSMPRAEAAGFQIVLHVHDELVTEFDPRTELTLDNLCEILAAPVHWAPGLPLSAAGFVSDRYRK